MYRIEIISEITSDGIGVSRLYPSATSYALADLQRMAEDMYATIFETLNKAGFNLLEGTITTDQQYRYLDITVQGASGVDAPRYCLLQPIAPTTAFPMLFSYYGNSVEDTGSVIALINSYPDGVIPNEIYALSPEHPLLEANKDVKLTVVGNGAAGCFWFVVTQNDITYVHNVATFSKRVPADASPPETTLARYGTFALTGSFKVPYGVTEAYEGGSLVPSDPYYGTVCTPQSLLSSSKLVTGNAEGLSDAIAASVVPVLENFDWGTGYQVAPNAICGNLVGIKAIRTSSPINEWSTFVVDSQKYVVLIDGFIKSLTGDYSYDTFALFIPNDVLTLPDFV